MIPRLCNVTHSKTGEAQTEKDPGSFPVVPLPQYVMQPPVTEHVSYIVNHYVKIWVVRLGIANNMHPLSWGGGEEGWMGTNGKDKISQTFQYPKLSVLVKLTQANNCNIYACNSPLKGLKNKIRIDSVLPPPPPLA